MSYWKTSPIRCTSDSLVRKDVIETKSKPESKLSSIVVPEKEQSDSYQKLLASASAMFDDDVDNSPVRRKKSPSTTRMKASRAQSVLEPSQDPIASDEMEFVGPNSGKGDLLEDRKVGDSADALIDNSPKETPTTPTLSKCKLDDDLDAYIAARGDDSAISNNYGFGTYESLLDENSKIESEHQDLTAKSEHAPEDKGASYDFDTSDINRDKWTKYKDDSDLMHYMSYLIMIEEEFKFLGTDVTTTDDSCFAVAQRIEEQIRQHITVPLDTLQLSVFTTHQELVQDGIFTQQENGQYLR